MSYHVVVDFVARVVSKLNVSVLGWHAQLGAETGMEVGGVEGAVECKSPIARLIT